MADTQSSELFLYADASGMEWQQTRPGSRRKILHNDVETGKLTMLVQWDAGYRTSVLERHTNDEHLYILSGVDERHACGPGTRQSINARHLTVVLSLRACRADSLRNGVFANYMITFP
jgi:hypothetical protein